jgi:hypothetical protein
VKSSGPAGPGLPGRADDQGVVLDADFDLIAQARLIEQPFRDADAPRMADADGASS